MTILLRSVLPYKAAILALVLYVLPSQAQDVRIRLLDKQAPTSITLSAYEGAVRLHAGDYTDPLLEIETGQTVLISPIRSFERTQGIVGRTHLVHAVSSCRTGGRRLFRYRDAGR